MNIKVPEILATRELYYSDKNRRERKKLIISLHAPTLVLKSTDGCDAYDGLFTCFVEFSSLISGHHFYGYDAFQAIGSASNIDPVLKGMLKYHDIFFGPTGPRYFDNKDNVQPVKIITGGRSAQLIVN